MYESYNRNMRILALFILLSISAVAADWKIDYKVAKNAVANEETPITITVRDEKNKPLSGADVEAVLTMVEMDHGEFKYAAKQTKAGTYQATVKYVMGGAWQLEVRARKGSDSVTKKFQFNIKQ